MQPPAPTHERAPAPDDPDGTFAVRRASGDDVPALLPMVDAICRHHQALDPLRFSFLPDVVDRYRVWLPVRAADPASVLLIAVDRHGPIGFLVGESVNEVPVYTLRRYGFIHDLWVEPRARRRGTGRALVTAATQAFADMGLEQVRGEAAAANSGARRMLAALGFAESTVGVLSVLGGRPGVTGPDVRER